MDVVVIERDFVCYLAGKLSLSVDNSIFRGGIPDGQETGVGVLLGSEINQTTFYGFRPRCWNAQILGKFVSRDDAIVFLSKLSGSFPCYDESCNFTKFLSILPRGGAEPYIASDDGVEKSYVSFNVVLTVLTNGTQL